MLQPENRLTKVRDFNLLMKQGRWLKGDFIDLRYSHLEKISEEFLPKRIEPSEFRKQLKIAFTVGLKVDKRAVVRNRLKRQLREVVRLLVKEHAIRTGNYILFVARKEMIGKSYEAIQHEVVRLLSLARVIR